MLFYVSPVFYLAEMVPEPIRQAYLLSPIAGVLTLYRAVLYDGSFPDPLLFAGPAAAALLIFIACYAIFARYEALFAEVVRENLAAGRTLPGGRQAILLLRAPHPFTAGVLHPQRTPPPHPRPLGRVYDF